MGLFKAYDLRGIYGDDLTEDIAYKIGRAFVTFLKCKTVVVGHDMRPSSAPLQDALVEGLTDQGANVIKIGLCTTPMMYFAVEHLKADAGISVTASHNPAQYNGFKLVREHAIPLSGDSGIYDIRDSVEKNDFPDSDEKGSSTETDEILHAYIKNESSFVDVKKLKAFKIVIDTGNGMAGVIIPEFMKGIPGEYTHMFPELDGTFPNHEANPLKTETLAALMEEVKRQRAHIGIAFDGDADRVGFVDEKGSHVPQDLLIALIAKEILKKHPGATITYDLRASKAVPEAIKASGGNPSISRVGHVFIKEQMRKENAAFGGELSAHYFLQSNNYIESPFVVCLLILELMSETGKKLSELWEPLQKYYSTGEVNFEVDDKDAAIARVKAAFSDAKNTFELDGLTIEYSDWWLNIRPSNTESLLRLNLEAHTKEKRDEMKKKVVEILES